MGVIEPGGNVIEATPSRIEAYSVGSPALGAADDVLAAYTDDGAAAVFPADQAFAGQPDVARNITATAGGTAGDVAAIQVTVTGTDINGNVISEDLPAFTVNTTGIVTGTKCFKTVTQIDIPAHDGTGATTAVGLGAKLGLPVKTSRDTVIAAFFGGVREATRPTVTFSSSALESNGLTLNTALDGSSVVVDFYRPGS